MPTRTGPAEPQKSSAPARLRAPVDALLDSLSPHPASHLLLSTCAHHTLQSSCARLLSTEPWFFEQRPSLLGGFGADTVIQTGDQASGGGGVGEWDAAL